MSIRRFITCRSRRFATILAAAAIAASAHAALAAPRGPASHRQPRPAAAGMLIGIDPVTGALGMPDAEQRARLEARAPRLAELNASRPAPVFHANGSASMCAGTAATRTERRSRPASITSGCGRARSTRGNLW